MQHVLEVKNLVKDYGTYRAVDHISFNIKKGQVLGLLGPNGAGKSTTIQMLVGVTSVTGGTIRYFGKDFATHRQASLQRLNYASAYNTLQFRISVKENLLVYAHLYSVANPREKIAELMDYFEISRLANRKYRDLSAGEKTRVNLVKALLNDPELILMDEPTASLDPDIADKTLSLIERLRAERELSILFTSHNMSEVERVCDEVAFLDRGSIVSHDTPRNHTSRIDEVFVTLHCGGSPAKIKAALKPLQLDYTLEAAGAVRIKTKAGQTAGVIAAVANQHITIHDVDIRKPTLEDVFLEIARKERT